MICLVLSPQCYEAYMGPIIVILSMKKMRRKKLRNSAGTHDPDPYFKYYENHKWLFRLS